MSDEQNNLPSEIEESTTQVESTAESQDTSTPQVESERESLETSQEPPKTNYAEKQQEAWVTNITNGDKDLSDLENNPSLKWLLPKVKKELGIEAVTSDIGEAVERYNQKKEFEKNKDFLKSLPVKLHNQIVKDAKERVQDGATTENALSRAISKAQTEIDAVSTQKSGKRTGMKMPTGSPSTSKVSYSQQEVSNLSQADYNRVMESYDKGDITIT